MHSIVYPTQYIPTCDYVESCYIGFFFQFMGFWDIRLGYTEMEMMLYSQNVHHWLHRNFNFDKV